MRAYDRNERLLGQGKVVRLASCLFVKKELQGRVCKVERLFDEEELEQLKLFLEENYGADATEVIFRQGAPVWLDDGMWAMSRSLELLETVCPEAGDWEALEEICGWRPES